MIGQLQTVSHSITQKSYIFNMIRAVKVIYTNSKINSAYMYVLGVCVIGCNFLVCFSLCMFFYSCILDFLIRRLALCNISFAN